MFVGGLPMSASLADLGFEALSLFQRIQVVDSDKPFQEWPATSFTAEAERFELWAVNLGLFVVGHGSLDYRVREADRLAQTIRRFLQELINSLAEVIQIRTGGRDEQSFNDNDDDGGDDDDDPEAEESDSEPSDDDTAESDLDLLLDGIRDPIDRLYKVSTKIRNPSSRLGSSRAANHQQIDEETGVDFLRAVEQADYDHIRSLFLQYQKTRALQELDTVDPTRDAVGGGDDEDGVWEPIRTVLSQHGAAESFLIRRIARANVRRRQQFAYRKMHREKLARHARASISTQGVLTPGVEVPSQPSFDRHISNDSYIPQAELAPPTASVTTATNLNLARLELVENQSMFTVSEYAPSTWQPARDAVAFPPPPTTQSGEKFFECPYCFTFCPRGALAAKAWKAHLIHDLSPYICTYEDCRNPDQLYDDRHDWGHHENSCHRKVWRCPEHSGQAFTQLEAYQDHLRNQHTDYGGDTSVNRIIRASESIMTAIDRPCPVCSIVLDTPKALQSHIALHLERFSLFSLPRSVACGGDDDDDVTNADSDKANGTIEDSRDEDFGGDLDIKSENAGSEVEAASETSDNKMKMGEEPTEAPNKKTYEEMSRVPEVKIELTEEVVQAIDSKVDVAEEARSAEFEDNLIVIGTTVKVFEDHNTPVYTVAFSPGDRLLASVSDDKVVRLWDLESGASPTPLNGHKSGFRSLAWSHDGWTIASGSYDKTIKLWDVSTSTCLHTLSGHEGAVSGLSFSSDDKLLASASHDKTCKLWDVSTGTARFTLKGHTAGIWSTGISPDDKYIVSGSNDRTVKIWDLATGALVHTLKGHGRVIYTLAFTPNSQILATGSNDWTIKLWDLGSGKLLRSIKSHEKGVTALAFSPDGSLMASASYDHMIKMWETTTWTNIGVLEGHSADVYGVAFSRDGQRIASGSRDRMVRLWDLRPERRALPVDHAAQSVTL